MIKNYSLFCISLVVLGLAGCGLPNAEEETPAVPDLITRPESQILVASREEIRRATGDSPEAARTIASRYLQHALGKAKDPKTRGLLEEMVRGLAGAQLDVPPAGQDLQTCVEEPAVLAFVHSLSPHTIHLCARAAGASSKKLAQVLVHETAHVVGVHDECAATEVEVQVLRAAARRLAFRNGYMKKCRIR